MIRLHEMESTQKLINQLCHERIEFINNSFIQVINIHHDKKIIK